MKHKEKTRKYVFKGVYEEKLHKIIKIKNKW